MSGELHGRPSVDELLEATIDFLRDQLPDHVDDGARHQVRIAAHALDIVRRELELRPDQDAGHRQRLAELGFETDADLADAIRSGALPDTPRLRLLLLEDTKDRLLVANPRWIDEDRRPEPDTARNTGGGPSDGEPPPPP